ncbi:MAG: ABC transporter ATP-binding protein [Bacillota bacterium]
MLRTLSIALRMIRGEYGILGVVTATSAAASLTFVIYIDTVRRLIGSIIAIDQGAALRWLLIAAMAVTAETILSTALIIMRKRLHCSILTKLRESFFGKLNSLRLAALERYLQADLFTRFLDDLEGVAGFFSRDLIDIATNLVLTLTLLGYVFVHEWRLLIVVVIALPLALRTTSKHGQRLQQAAGELQRETAGRNALVKDILDHRLEIRALRALPFFSGRYGDAERRTLASDQRRIHHRTMIWGSSISLYHVIFLFFYGAGAILAFYQRVEFGLIIGLYLMIDRLVDLLMGLPGMFTAFYELSPKAERVSEVLHLSEEETSSLRAVGSQTDGEPVIVDGLSYAYGEGRRVLSELSLRIRAGERIAIVGESGCGKSTLLRLIAAYDEHYQGSLSVFGREMRDWSPTDLRQRVTYCPQQPFLMAKSILANFEAYFGDIAVDDLRRCARWVDLDREIEALKDQYATVLEHGGANLSGGQRQRLGLMLGLMKRSDLLLIDEGLSALDPQMAERVLDNMFTVIRSTIVLVTHRLQDSLMSRFDRIVVMADGRVAAVGTHQELMNHPIYRELHDKAISGQGGEL